MKIDKIAEDIRALFEESIDSSQSCGVEYDIGNDYISISIYDENEDIEYDLENIDESLIEVVRFVINKLGIRIEYLNEDYQYDIDLRMFQNILDIFN